MQISRERCAVEAVDIRFEGTHWTNEPKKRDEHQLEQRDRNSQRERSSLRMAGGASRRVMRLMHAYTVQAKTTQVSKQTRKVREVHRNDAK
jgi:hypothetical protein